MLRMFQCGGIGPSIQLHTPLLQWQTCRESMFLSNIWCHDEQKVDSLEWAWTHFIVIKWGSETYVSLQFYARGNVAGLRSVSWWCNFFLTEAFWNSSLCYVWQNNYPFRDHWRISLHISEGRAIVDFATAVKITSNFCRQQAAHLVIQL